MQYEGFIDMIFVMWYSSLIERERGTEGDFTADQKRGKAAMGIMTQEYSEKRHSNRGTDTTRSFQDDLSPLSRRATDPIVLGIFTPTPTTTTTATDIDAVTVVVMVVVLACCGLVEGSLGAGGWSRRRWSWAGSSRTGPLKVSLLSAGAAFIGGCLHGGLLNREMALTLVLRHTVGRVMRRRRRRTSSVEACLCLFDLDRDSVAHSTRGLMG